MKNKINLIKSVLFNIPGWRTGRKIIVFESDDWGSIRIPDKNVLTFLVKNGYNIDKSPYIKDSLESNEDITMLLEILSTFRLKNGNYPVFTLNTIVANPDFEKIKQSGYKEYYYEYFTETYKRYPHREKSFDLIKEGYYLNIFKPQLHGREHINFKRWIKALEEGHKETLLLFNKNIAGIPFSIAKTIQKDYQRVFDYKNNSKLFCEIINDASRIFKEIWGFLPLSFIAPNFFWDNYIEECLSKIGIKYIQGQRAQFIPRIDGTYIPKYHFIGQKNKLNQIYLIRNCFFEPAFDLKKDWVGSCLREISLAFRLQKPAIISTHRVNYIGSIDESNRNRNIAMLKQLLKKIVTLWPDVEFMSTDQLGEMIIAP